MFKRAKHRIWNECLRDACNGEYKYDYTLRVMIEYESIYKIEEVLCKFCGTTKRVRTLDGKSWAIDHHPLCQILMNSTTT